MSDVAIDYEKKYRKLIIALSVIIPLAVAALFGMKIEGYDTSFLPPVYATVNGLTAVFLLIAVYFIKKGNRKMHERMIKICIALSVSFLAMYIVYHITSESAKFGGDGAVKYLYFFILITHIILSVVIIPFVLFTYVKAWSGKFTDHKRLARVTFPLWLYVAVSGVAVYLMISPYY